MPTSRLTSEILEAAILGFESRKGQIDAQVTELRGLLDGRGTAPTGAKRTLSAAARAGAAQEVGCLEKGGGITDTLVGPSPCAWGRQREADGYPP